MSRPADKGYCKQTAQRLGIPPTVAEEAFLGEDIDECNRIVRWIEQQEVEMRAEYGWSYTFRYFTPARMLRAWARKNGKGAFSGGV